MKAHQILSDESKWCKGANARDSSGRSVSSDSPSAVCFCLRGSIYRAYDDEISWDKCFHSLAGRVGKCLATWNDAPERTFAEVKAVLVELDL